MLRSVGFDAIMTKYNFASNNDGVFVGVSLKYSSVGDTQFFLESFEKELKTSNIQSVLNYPVRWSKMSFDFEDYDQYVAVEFGDIIFDAKIMSINISRKLKDGSEVFDYIINFVKDVEGGDRDAMISSTYLKHKEENEEGKKVLVKYPVVMKLIDKPQTQKTNNNSDVL